MDPLLSVALVHVGFGGMPAAHRVFTILGADSSPTRRMIRHAKEEGRAIDMTNGRKTKAVIILDSDHLALAALHPEAIADRLNGLAGREADAHDQ